MAEKTQTDNKNIEREYIIPLRHRWSIVPRYKRTNKAVKAVKEFLVRHMKIRDRDLDKVKIDKYLNELLWSRGIRSPPSKIKVKAIKEGDIVRVYAANLPSSINFKKLRKEKVEMSAKEISKKKKEEKAEEAQAEVKPEETGEKKDEQKEKENKASTVQAGQEMEKAAAKQMKHEKRQDMKQPKHQRRMALEK